MKCGIIVSHCVGRYQICIISWPSINFQSYGKGFNLMQWSGQYTYKQTNKQTFQNSPLYTIGHTFQLDGHVPGDIVPRYS